jgi:hypothetical protein
MLWYEGVITALVGWACIGGLWRPSALALVGAWAIGQTVYLITNDSLPIALYRLTDAIAVFIILRYKGSNLDYAILALFVPMWWSYVRQSGSEQWWTLWAISSLQFFLAGPWPQLQRIIFSISHGPRRAKV